MLVIININGWMKLQDVQINIVNRGIIDFSPELRVNCLPPEEPPKIGIIPVYTCIYKGKKKFGYLEFEFKG